MRKKWSVPPLSGVSRNGTEECRSRHSVFRAVNNNNNHHNNVHLTCAHQRPERSHDTY